MINERTVFVIPGFRQQPKNKAYKQISKILRSQGFSPILVKVPWKQTTISENTTYFLKKYKSVKAKKKYILGFSFGAMIAFLASTKVKTSGLILCSLSPYFKEDLYSAKNIAIQSTTPKRYYDFSQLHCEALVKKVKAKQILMLYGARETRSLKKRVTETFAQIDVDEKYLLSIKETEHDIGDRRYIYTITQAVRELN